MKLLLAFNFLFASSVYAADFSGTWKGNGTYESTSWGHFQSQVEIVVVQSKDKLSARDCWSFVRDSANWHVCSESQFDLKADEIWYKGVLVGKINGNSLEIAFADFSTSITAKVTLNSNQRLDYSYDAHDAQGGYIKNVASGLAQ